MVVEMKKTQREAELVAARRAIEKVALKEHKTVEEVRTAMIEAMTEGFNSKDSVKEIIKKVTSMEINAIQETNNILDPLRR